jgi:hypothetical protein
MCLSKITRSISKPSMRVRWAWKGFQSSSLYPGCRSLTSASRGTDIKRGVWVKDRAKGLIRSGSKYYPKGFHVSLSRSGAKFWGHPLRVKVRRIHTFGTQHGKAMVAKEIFIPKPKKGGR